MVDAEEWRRKIRAATNSRPAPVVAKLCVKELKSTTRAVVILFDDGEQYAVKGRQSECIGQLGKALVSEQVVGRLGCALDAPVASVRLVSVPEGLIRADACLQHICGGLAHGSKWIEACEDLDSIE